MRGGSIRNVMKRLRRKAELKILRFMDEYYVLISGFNPNIEPNVNNPERIHIGWQRGVMGTFLVSNASPSTTGLYNIATVPIGLSIVSFFINQGLAGKQKRPVVQKFTYIDTQQDDDSQY